VCQVSVHMRDRLINAAICRLVRYPLIHKKRKKAPGVRGFR